MICLIKGGRSVRPDQAGGFTLLEIIMVLVLVGILAIGAGLGLFQAIQGALFAEKNVQSVVDSDTLKNLSITMSRIYTVKNVTGPTSFTYTVLTDNGTAMGPSSSKTFTAPAGVTISYLDSNGTATSTPEEVRFFVLSQNATVGDGSTKIYRLRVAPYHLNYQNN